MQTVGEERRVQRVAAMRFAWALEKGKKKREERNIFFFFRHREKTFEMMMLLLRPEVDIPIYCGFVTPEKKKKEKNLLS